MKILFLSAASSIHTVKWVNALAARNHEVHLVYNQGHNPRDNRISDNVILHCMKYSGTKAYYLNALELKKIEKKINPDVINVHYASGYGTLARVARLGDYLLSIWGSDVYEFPYQSKIKKIILEKNVKYAKMLASTSNCMAEQLKKVLRDNTLDIAITPFGVDLDLFSSEKYKKVEEDRIIIGNIKALEKHYGIEVMIKAFHLLCSSLIESGKEEIVNKLQMEIYGDGSQKDELVQLIKDLKMEDKIFLKGRIENKKVPETLMKFSIFCAASRHESFGVAVVEAMAMKIPVVVTDADGLKEVVCDFETGIIVEKESIQQIADALRVLVEDEEKRLLFGINGRKRVESLYDWKKNVTTMERLYKKLERRG